MNTRTIGMALGWLMILAGGISRADTTWTNVPAGTAWELADNWNNGVPYGTAVLRANVLPTGIAQLTNAAASYTVNVTQPTTFNDLTIKNGGATITTVNLNTNVSLVGVNQVGTQLGQLDLYSSAVLNVASNVTVTVGGGIRCTSASVLNVNPGAVLIWSEQGANQFLTVNSGTVNVRGTLRATTSDWRGNQPIQMENGAGNSYLNIDGGVVEGYSVEVGYRGFGTLTVTNQGTLILRKETTAEERALIVGRGINVNYGGTLNQSSGMVSNNNALYLARQPNTSALTGYGTINVSGGTFIQLGISTVGEARNGTITVSGSGVFVAQKSVYVGGTVAPSLGLSGSATASGKIQVLGGRFVVTNSAGTATLFVGNAVSGTVTLASGTMIVNALSVTNGAASVMNFNGGTLLTGDTTINNDSIFTVGNGSSAATLGLLTGAHSFANGLTVAANAVFATGGTNAVATATITGNVMLQSSAVLDCDFNATANDSTSITGTLTLPASATLRARSLDGARPSVIPVMQATTISGDASGWNKVQVGAHQYRAVVVGNQLQLQRIENGTCILIR